jgi:hypothetical protein
MTRCLHCVRSPFATFRMGFGSGLWVLAWPRRSRSVKLLMPAREGAGEGVAARFDDPGTTLTLLKLNAVVGVQGTLNGDGSLRSVGLTCAVCHSTVDDSFAPGIGRRLDGWANRDLNSGAIIALSPGLNAISKLLGVDDATTRKVLASWGPGKFDAELNLDGKAFRPDGKPAATLIPPAFGMAGVNLHTWTGGMGHGHLLERVRRQP